MLCPQGSEGADGVGATILCKSPWDHLQARSNRLVGPLDNTFEGLSLLSEQMSYLHLCGSSARHQCGLLIEVPSHVQSVLKIPLHLIQDVFASAAEKDCAGFGIFALLNEGEVLVSDLFYVRFFLLQDLAEVTLVHDLNVGL